MILVIDNFDSFVYNLARYVETTGHPTYVVRNNSITLEEIAQLSPSHIIISPGPGTPADAGISLDLVSKFYKAIPILGVCLGHQVIGQAFNAHITYAKHPMHGKTSCITHQGNGIFTNIPQTIKVTRYHSLIVENITAESELIVTATTLDNEIMALQHKAYPVFGVQFHPEAILTEYGMEIIRNFVSK
ncbi:MAG: aminodeoxychorismate/anthranilate synthase component II [Proteobacteria bacterium]|jgi:para-aminobenzoate synthetase component 2|nr:aminodeoxychorismate/anthranilate synthase component II [Pseudomonadota bacterium]